MGEPFMFDSKVDDDDDDDDMGSDDVLAEASKIPLAFKPLAAPYTDKMTLSISHIKQTDDSLRFTVECAFLKWGHAK
jgi:hypothetical protein